MRSKREIGHDRKAADSAKLLESVHAARTVVLVAFEGVQPIDVSGPASVFGAANQRQPGSYEVLLASPRGGTIGTGTALAFANTTPLASLPPRIDTVLVAGGTEEGMRQAMFDDGLCEWLREVEPKVRRVGSVCSGAFALGAAGLLDGRRATTHWASCGWLRQLCPQTQVEPDAIFAIDGKIFTSAGVTTAIDLSLALVEQDLGRKLAADVARELVVFVRRPGGQSQYSAALAAQASASSVLSEVISWAIEHPTADLSVAGLAKKAAMSERNFGRVFTRETGQKPARFVELLRVDRARLYLEDTDWALERVAERSGFGSVDGLHRAFKRSLAVTPAEYRGRFSSRPRPSR